MTKATLLWCWLAFAALLLLAPWVFSSGLGLSVLSQIGIAMIACLSYNLLYGQGGMLSFGHAVYSGAGAYMAIHVLNQVSAGGMFFIPVSVLPLVGGLAGLLLAALLGWFSTRHSGMPFAMISLGVAELAFAAVLMFPEVFGGEAGISGNRVVGQPVAGVDFSSGWQLYHLIAAYTWLAALALYVFTRTPLGLLLGAVRDNAQRVSFMGYSAHRIRYTAFVIAGFFAGVAGGLSALLFEIVTAEVLGTARSGAYLIFTVVGGSGHFVGPMVGAVLMVCSAVLLSSWTRAWLLYLGLLFLLVVIFSKGGVVGAVVNGVKRCRQPGVWADLMSQPRRWLAWLGGLLGLVALVVLIEMIYHLQWGAVVGSRLVFLGLPLDVQQVWHWVASLLLLAVGAGLWTWARERRP
ncbi:MAG: branched-chain amino acid ABC transporter permease [Burkholderiales bacterium]